MRWISNKIDNVILEASQKDFSFRKNQGDNFHADAFMSEYISN
jgi:hypothetical protein